MGRLWQPQELKSKKNLQTFGKTNDFPWQCNRAGNFDFAGPIAGRFQAGSCVTLTVTPAL